MKQNMYPNSEDTILSSQLTMLLARIRNAVLPTCLVLILLFWTISADGSTAWSWTWFLAALMLTVAIGLYSNRLLITRLHTQQARFALLKLALLHVADGVILGAVAWIEPATMVADNVLIFSVLVASLSYFMVQLSPVLPVFYAKVIPMLLLMVGKLWTIWDPGFTRFAIAVSIYLLIIFFSSRSKNIKLLGYLRTEQAYRDKFAMISDSIHEIRQPIHAQSLFSDMVLSEPVSSRQRQAIENIEVASHLFDDTLKTLLNFSRIEAGTYSPSVISFALQPVLNQIEREVSSRAETKGIQYLSRETQIVLRSDPMLVEMILRNLVLNAIRRTNQGGVLVACRKRGDTAILEVWDTCNDKNMGSQTSKFRALTQDALQNKLQQKGSNLELEFANLHAIKLGVELKASTLLNLGNVVRFSVPIA